MTTETQPGKVQILVPKGNLAFGRLFAIVCTHEGIQANVGALENFTAEEQPEDSQPNSAVVIDSDFDGYDALSAIRALPGAKIIVTTFGDSPKLDARFQNAGATVIHKPLSNEVVENLITTIKTKKTT
jgi:hypothetical protein